MAQIRLVNQSATPIEIVWWGARTDLAGWFDYYDVHGNCGKDPKDIPQGQAHRLDVGLTTRPPTVVVYAVGLTDGTMTADDPYPKYVQLLHEEMLADLDKMEKILREAKADTAFPGVLNQFERLQDDARKRWASIRASRSYWPHKNPIPAGELDPISNCEFRMIDQFVNSVNGSNLWRPDSSGNLPAAKSLLDTTIPAMRRRLQPSRAARHGQQ